MSFGDFLDKAISEAHASRSGWDIERHDHSNPFDCHCVYVADFRLQHLRLFSIPMKALAETPITPVPESLVAPMVDITRKFARGQAVGKEDSSTVARVLCQYIRSTQSYALWRDRQGTEQRFHALLHIYPVPGEQNDMARPAIFHHRQPIADVEQVCTFSKHLLEVDQGNHPEWFERRN